MVYRIQTNNNDNIVLILGFASRRVSIPNRTYARTKTKITVVNCLTWS